MQIFIQTMKTRTIKTHTNQKQRYTQPSPQKLFSSWILLQFTSIESHSKLIWWLLVMVTIGVVVAACGGAMKGQWEERALGKRKKKWRRRRDREKNGLEWECQTDFWRETLCDGTSHMGGSHSLLNFTKMPLKLNSQKLKTPKSCFHFPSSTSKILSIWVMKTMIQN